MPPPPPRQCLVITELINFLPHAVKVKTNERQVEKKLDVGFFSSNNKDYNHNYDIDDILIFICTF